MLTGIHFLLTYKCTSKCDHCFLHCSPDAQGTFTLPQMYTVFDEIDKLGSIGSVYFEGGEPFLYYPVMLEGIRLSRKRELKVGIVTNAYWATSVADAELWLKPLVELGVDDLSISDDDFHRWSDDDNSARNASEAALRLGLPSSSICIESPVVKAGDKTLDDKSIVGGNVRFRGRAADTLTEGLPRVSCRHMNACDRETLDDPGRVHIDAFGHLHMCQGISMGNMWETPLSQLATEYDPQAHPIVGPLLKGGPLQLAKEYGVEHEEGYVDECHFCYDVRKKLVSEYPAVLAPRQVYGLDNSEPE